MKIHPLKYERELRGWSQAKVAEEIGTTVRSVSRWERGIAVPYPYFREQLCTLYGKNAIELGLIAEKAQELPAVKSTLFPSLPVAESQKANVYDPAIPVSLENIGLIGRDSLLAHLKQLICTGNHLALTAINGLPGVGKTALAVALATDREVQKHFYDGILWVGLGTQPNVLGLLAHWGMLLNVPASHVKDASSWEAWGKALHAIIGTRRMLLVIDDAWKIEEALAFQIGGPHCAHLLTTRIPQVAFAFARERAVEVPQLDDTDGLALMARFAPEIVALEAESAQALVRSVGALPLALTLMGKYLATQAFTKQPRRLRAAIAQLKDAERRLRLSVPTPITTRSPSLPAGTPLSLHAAIAVSDQQISGEARRALQALSVLPAKPNSFSEEMAMAVAGVAVEVLDELSDAGLLESSGPGRYTLHQTISDYARIHHEGTASLQRFIKYCVSYVKAHQSDYELLDLEINNMLAAFDAAYQIGYYLELLQGLYALIHFLEVRGLHSLIVKRLQQAYTVARAINSSDDIIHIACYLGEIALTLGADIPVEDYLQEGLRLAKQAGDQRQICRLLAGLGQRAGWLGNFVEVEMYCQEGLTIARRLESNELIVAHLTALAWATYEQQNYTYAANLCQEALTLARQINHQEYIGILLAASGWIATAQGRYAQAEAYYQEGLATTNAMPHRLALSFLLTGQGWLAGKLKNYAEAEQYTREALALARQMSFHELTHRLLTSLGWLAEKRGAYNETDAYYQEALLLVQQHKKPHLLCMLLFHLGSLRLKQRQFVDAATIFHKMLEQAPAGRHDLVELAHDGLARLAITQSKRDYTQASFSYGEDVDEHLIT
jgi:transcriptional regulator with XRE-family HTH domain/tetratricopeptide (TPR) repeat protein